MDIGSFPICYKHSLQFFNFLKAATPFSTTNIRGRGRGSCLWVFREIFLKGVLGDAKESRGSPIFVLNLIFLTNFQTLPYTHYLCASIYVFNCLSLILTPQTQNAEKVFLFLFLMIY
jgi:hypothetical protein